MSAYRDKPNAKITYAEAQAIRENYAQGVGARELAQIHGLSTESVRRIIRGETWGENPVPPPISPPSLAERMAAEASLKRLQQMVSGEDAQLAHLEGTETEEQKALRERAEELMGRK